MLEKMALFATSRYPIGTHVLDEDWDLLIVLDTCRVDAIEAVAPEYEFIKDIDSIWSLGGSSQDWIGHTFDRSKCEILANTGYITANPHAETVLEDREYKSAKHSRGVEKFYRYGSWDPVQSHELGLLEHMWKYESKGEDGSFGHTKGYTPPEYVTDMAISVGRKRNLDRFILHYMQPHSPWVSNAIEEGRDLRDHEEHPSRVKTEGKSRVFKAYLDELRYVLDNISVLLENFSAETVVITADHGEAFGEHRLYGHDPGRFHPKVRYVPWVKTTARDEALYKPDIDRFRKSKVSTEEQLEALGYK